jgi:hypothetical protein
VQPSNSIQDSRREFLSKGLKLAGLAMLLSPMKNVWAQANGPINPLSDIRLVLNKHKKTVHLNGAKYFSEQPKFAEKNLEVVDWSSWESKVKSPVHFRKDRSGRIIEVLALRKLEGGINDKSLNAVVNTLSLAFTPAYKDNEDHFVNKFNFRLHELLIKAIALNTSITVFGRWDKFQLATGKINYAMLPKGEKLPPRMNWLLSRTKFDQQVFHILAHKENYISRLKQRVADNKI